MILSLLHQARHGYTDSPLWNFKKELDVQLGEHMVSRQLPAGSSAGVHSKYRRLLPLRSPLPGGGSIQEGVRGSSKSVINLIAQGIAPALALLSREPSGRMT